MKMHWKCYLFGHDENIMPTKTTCRRCGMHSYYDDPRNPYYHRGEGDYYATWGGLWWLREAWHGNRRAPIRALKDVFPWRCSECGAWHWGSESFCECELPF